MKYVYFLFTAISLFNSNQAYALNSQKMTVTASVTVVNNDLFGLKQNSRLILNQDIEKLPLKTRIDANSKYVKSIDTFNIDGIGKFSSVKIEVSDSIKLYNKGNKEDYLVVNEMEAKEKLDSIKKDSLQFEINFTLNKENREYSRGIYEGTYEINITY